MKINKKREIIRHAKSFKTISGKDLKIGIQIQNNAPFHKFEKSKQSTHKHEIMFLAKNKLFLNVYLMK